MRSPVRLACVATLLAVVVAPTSRTPAQLPAVTFERRLLAVQNRSAERVTVFVQARDFNADARQWEWLPAAGQALAFEVEPGQTRPLEAVGRPVGGSDVRLWATSDSLTWEANRTADMPLVAAAPSGKREYEATAVETFTYVLQGPAGDEPLPPNAAAERGKPRVAAGGPFDPAPAPPPFDPAALPPAAPAPPLVVVPQPVAAPIPIPAAIPLPNVPIVVEADLAAVAFDVRLTGAFTGTIRNLGPAIYTGGRGFAVLRAVGDGPYIVVQSGLIPPLLPGGMVVVTGTADAITRPTRYALQLTAGDTLPGNDVIGQAVIPPPPADLAVSNLRYAAGAVRVDVRNNGPSDYVGEFRRLTVGDHRRVLLPAPVGKAINALAAGQAVTLTFPTRGVDPGPGNGLIAALDPGDSDPSNDRVAVPLPSGGGAFAVTLALDATRTQLIPTVRNASGSRTPQTTLTIGPAAGTARTPLVVPPLAAGESRALPPYAPPARPGVQQVVTVTLQPPGGPVQELARIAFQSPAAVALTLGAVQVDVATGVLRFTVTNPAATAVEAGADRYTVVIDGATVVAAKPTPAVAARGTTAVAESLAALPVGSHTATVRLASGASQAVRFTKAGGGVANVVVARSLFVGQTAVQVQVRNVGTAAATGKTVTVSLVGGVGPPVRLTPQALPSVAPGQTQTVTVPIPAGTVIVGRQIQATVN